MNANIILVKHLDANFINNNFLLIQLNSWNFNPAVLTPSYKRPYEFYTAILTHSDQLEQHS